MADLVITAANVAARGGAKTGDGTAGATITAGQGVALDPADGKLKLWDSNGAAALRKPYGIALHGSSNGQPLRVHRKGPLTLGATLAAGVAYYMSDTPGGICPVADVGTGETATLLGMATSTTVLEVDFLESGVQL